MTDRVYTQVLHNFSQNEVHIYEKEDWWGGHAHTVGFQRECLFYINRELLFIPPRDHIEPGKEKCEIDTAFASVLSFLSFHFEMLADPLSDRYQLEKLPQLLPFPPRSLCRAHQDYHVILPLS